MSSRLTILRSQLGRLRRARAASRAAAAWFAVGSGVLLALLGCLALDYVFHLAASERVLVLLLAIAVVVWSFWRFTAPLLGQHESEVALAALVEREHQIDSDLVAALQFESPDAHDWGSRQLSGAVIEYVAAAAPSIKVFKGFSSAVALRRGGLLLAGLAIWLLLAASVPRHLAVFANRMLLGAQHYPTRTRIDRIVVCETEVLSGDQERPKDCRAAQGRPLKFVVECSGRLPSAGSVVLSSVAPSQARTRLELKPNNGDSRGTRVFTTELPRLNDDLTFRISLGDAWSDAATVYVIPLPVIDVKVGATPPAYAAARARPANTAARQPPVLEGSSIEITVESKNRKPLKSAWLLLQTHGAHRYDLVPIDDDKLRWRLPDKTPLTSVRSDLQYEAQVVDMDGLSLESAIRGKIRVQADEPPTVAAETVHRVVLPTAQPVIHYRATDDYGIARLAIVLQVERARAEATGDTATDPRPLLAESYHFEILPAKQILTDDKLPAEGNYPLPLSQLALAKGDSVHVTVQVTDYRGTTATAATSGKLAQSNPLVLEISDESGVMAAISQADHRSEEQLTEIIKRQLGIGEER